MQTNVAMQLVYFFSLRRPKIITFYYCDFRAQAASYGCVECRKTLISIFPFQPYTSTYIIFVTCQNCIGRLTHKNVRYFAAEGPRSLTRLCKLQYQNYDTDSYLINYTKYTDSYLIGGPQMSTRRWIFFIIVKIVYTLYMIKSINFRSKMTYHLYRSK